ncbi:MAG: L,D-transpeptidase [Acidimicrobiia bacterium]|nr:L,D-transpeptidase [Acidimicrobiia bacterium]
MSTRPITTVTSTTGTSTSGRSTVAAVALLLALLASACNPFGGDAELQGEVYPTAPSSPGIANLYTASSTRAVVTDDHIVIYDSPDGDTLQTLPGATSFGTTRVMLVEAMAGDWIQVRLPTRPNHRLGWVRASDVTIETVEPVVHIDIEARTLTVVSGDEVVAQATVAVGTEDNPTPRGTFYVTDKLETPNPHGAYGPYALGLSGYSETLSEFAGGNGQIGIHGTNDPGSLGQAVSHGCIRLPNEVATWLADVLPLGTPVHIV